MRSQEDQGKARIFIRELHCSASVGVLPSEQHIRQPIAVSLEIQLAELAPATETDRLADTVDYAHLARLVRDVVAERHYPLVETLARRIGDATLAHTPRASRVRVRIGKLEAIDDATSTGVELSLSSSDVDPPHALTSPDSAHESLVVLGGGPAGLSAMLWCKRLGMPALLIDAAPQLGGQLHLIYRSIPDTPGIEPLTGSALAHRMARQFDGRYLRGCVQSVTQEDGHYALALTGGARLSATSLILATGVRRRALGVPGEHDFGGRGVLSTASRSNAALRGKRVLVVGGGDAACENALRLAEVSARVFLVHRRKALSARDSFQTQIVGHPRISLLLGTTVTAFAGDDRLDAVVLGGEHAQQLPVSAALVRVGWEPNSEAYPNHWLTPKRFVRVENQVRVTGQPLCFAVGDLRAGALPSVATAIGDGAYAAKLATAAMQSEHRPTR